MSTAGSEVGVEVPSGRFAPTPSGPLHLGSIRTAVVAWLAARVTGSAFRLRIEDLDPAARSEEHIRSQLDDLAVLGIDWDGPVVRQSERIPVYEELILSLSSSGQLYRCYCTRSEIRQAAQAPHGDLPEGAYPGTCRELTSSQVQDLERKGRPAALRVMAAGQTREFTDALHGAVAGSVDDFVIARNDGIPAYNLAVVVDDAEAGVEQVVRGDDLMSSTPRQVFLSELLGSVTPTFAHIPLVVGQDGVRLAKRHGSVTLRERLALGDSPQEVLGQIAHSIGVLRAPEPVELADLLPEFEISKIPRRSVILEELVG